MLNIIMREAIHIIIPISITVIMGIIMDITIMDIRIQVITTHNHQS